MKKVLATLFESKTVIVGLLFVVIAVAAFAVAQFVWLRYGTESPALNEFYSVLQWIYTIIAGKNTVDNVADKAPGILASRQSGIAQTTPPAAPGPPQAFNTPPPGGG